MTFEMMALRRQICRQFHTGNRCCQPFAHGCETSGSEHSKAERQLKFLSSLYRTDHHWTGDDVLNPAAIAGSPPGKLRRPIVAGFIPCFNRVRMIVGAKIFVGTLRYSFIPR